MEARSGCGDETAGRRRWQDQARACRPAGAVEEARIATGTGLGGGVRMERRGRRRLTGPRISARPGSCRQPHGEWARDRGGNEAGTGEGTRQGPGRERGRDRIGAEPSSHLPPPGSALAGTQRWSRRPGPAVLAPPPQQLPSGSRRECTHGRAATGPTAAHSRARQQRRA